MTRIKICGLTNAEDIRLCVAAGVQALGFVTEYPIPVPWNLDRQKARNLMGRVPPFVSRVIVVGDDPRIVVELAEFLKPHVVQLHGNEPVSVTKNIVRTLKTLGTQVIKALRFSVETGKCSSVCEDPLDAARQIVDTGVDALVLDSFSEARPAGTGQSMDWTIARNIRESVGLPVILAGGLNSGNVGQAVANVHPYGVDVISGVENPVGKKDPDKVRAFIKAASAVEQ
ncbi:MAG: N-(5'-phosphoribosyl)anthranilate isomerase [Syntrophorhabdus sp. PtaU1.Bin153]|nr:MAG: N-(5'-phosphoribosyl)anthranilate isomerase [Syntrophorhabdus sp. PtaU1.Bin153]